MRHHRNAHPTAPGALSQQALPGHHPAGSVAHLPHAMGAKPRLRPPGKSAAAQAAADNAANAIYAWQGTFDRIKLREGFIREFGKSAHYDAAAIPQMELLVGFIEADTRITDVRWTAYMLATAYWETTSLKKESVPVLDKHHKPVVGKNGKPLVRSRKRWAITLSPVEEVGHGAHRNYFLPVKVKSIPKGGARVTEQDGDQFTVTAEGTYKAITHGAKQGAAPTQKAVTAYKDDDGDEYAYYGRGYVQLTWWSNYAKASTELNLGLQLLLNPDDVLQPQIAYKVMAHGMLTGKGFANGRKFATYFHGAKTDYVGARHMVNGSDHAGDIAGIAQQFESILIAAKS
ncbi:hypothetical protein ACFWZ1_06380 [Frateuria sp. GZRe14]|uniref:hypothetical protein n=1 Tax=Frateuria sp. GZRe14 TaxID=3351534 RepID=UPI003EDBA37A